MHIQKEQDTHLWQCNIRDNDSVQGTGGVLQRLALVTVGVVLVFVFLAFIAIFDVPRHGVLGNTDVRLGGSAGGLASEVPARYTEHAGCDCENALELEVRFWLDMRGSR